MNPTIILFLLALTIIFLTLTSCKKDCFDQSLYDAHHGQMCTADCPGVTGCDGKFYCNECVANSEGIAVE